MQHPSLKPKELCNLAKMNFKTHGQYVRNLKRDFNRNYIFGLGSKLGKPTFHRARGCVYVDRLNLDREKALQSGWEVSKNRNRCLLWKRDPKGLGRMEWHFRTGRVNIYPKQPTSKGKVFQLFADGFSMTRLIDSMTVLELVLNSINLKGASAVWDLGIKLKPFVIDMFKVSNGIVIKGGDLSHPTGIEVEFCIPDWAEKAEAQLSRNTVVMEQLLKVFQGLQTTQQQEPRQPDKLETLPNFYTR